MKFMKNLKNFFSKNIIAMKFFFLILEFFKKEFTKVTILRKLPYLESSLSTPFLINQ